MTERSTVTRPAGTTGPAVPGQRDSSEAGPAAATLGTIRRPEPSNGGALAATDQGTLSRPVQKLRIPPGSRMLVVRERGDGPNPSLLVKLQTDPASGEQFLVRPRPTRPAPTPHQDPAARPPARRLKPLATWLDQQLELEQVSLTLPASGRRFTIHKPSEAASERLYAAAEADPGVPTPYWAEIWESGVALADAILSRRAEVAGRRVLELGSGLGVAASAALEAGASVLAVDCAALPLALCRLNALSNTGCSPRTLPCNWREPGRTFLSRVEAGGRFPLILAADLLYEQRDVAPLLRLVERLLAPSGMLWLAEPGRPEARQFLEILRTAGWDRLGSRLSVPAPEVDSDPVCVHFLRRPGYGDSLPATQEDRPGPEREQPGGEGHAT